MNRSQSEKRKLKETTELTTSSTLSLSSSFSIHSSSQCQCAKEDADGYVAGPSSVVVPSIKCTRGSKKIMKIHNFQLAKISDHAGVHILAAATRSLGHDPKELVLNHKFSWWDQVKFCAEAAKEIKNLFRPLVLLVMHWDGKMVQTATSGAAAKVSRLSVLVSRRALETSWEYQSFSLALDK